MASKKKNNNVVPSQKPGGKPSSLGKPTRNGDTFHVGWKTPKTATDKSQKNHWESQMAVWTFTQMFGETKYKAGSNTISDKKAKKLKKNPKYTIIDIKKNAKSTQYTNTANYTTFLKKYNSILYVTTKNSIVYKYDPKKVKRGSKKVTVYKEAKGATTQTGQKTVKCMLIPVKTTAITQKVDFGKYHPYVPYRYLQSAKVSVCGVNRKGTGKALSSSAYKFLAPTKPVLSGVTFGSDDGGNGVASISVDATSEGARQKSRTCYWITREDNFDSRYKSAQNITGKLYATSDKFDVSTDVISFAELTYSQYINLTFRAFSQGCNGDSGQATPARYTIAYPSMAFVNSIDLHYDQALVWDPITKKHVPSNDRHNGIVVVGVSFVDTKNHPVDKVELWRLKSKADTPERAAIATGWTKVKSDNGATTAMQDVIGGEDGAYPPTGLHVWYRLVTYHGPFERVGTAREVTELYHGPSKPSFINVRTVDDGSSPTAIELTYGFKQDEADGSQIEWSTFKNAWHSNHVPDTADDLMVLGEDDAKDVLTKYGKTGAEYDFVSQFYVTDLEEGAQYYLAAARFAETDGGRILGTRTFLRDPVDGIKPTMFAMRPKNVVMYAPTTVRPDTEYAVSWTFESDYEQTAYSLHYVTEDGQQILRSREESSEMATVITLAEIAKARQRNTDTGGYEIHLRVTVETSGLSATSDNASTKIYTPPDCQILWPDNTNVLTAQPMKIKYRATQPGHLILVVSAEGSSGEIAPGVDYVQADGDVVWSGTVDVAANYTDNDPAEFMLPENLEFHDKGHYTLTAYLLSTVSGLSSDVREIGFSVHWARQAMPPSSLSTIESDQDAKAVRIVARKPENFDPERPDVCDIYRVTPDGTYLVKGSVDFGVPVIDRYAPFSKTAILRYVLVTKTRDGDTAYVEIGYGLKGYAIRFEWDVDPETKAPRNMLEVPYNLRIGDSYTKDFERRAHLDGRVTGHWNPGIQRNGSLQTDLIRLSEPEQKELVRHLARYLGPVFVRTPDGCAYLADVQVTAFQNDYDSLVIPVTFDAKEIDLEPAYMAALQSETAGV